MRNPIKICSFFKDHCVYFDRISPYCICDFNAVKSYLKQQYLHFPCSLLTQFLIQSTLIKNRQLEKRGYTRRVINAGAYVDTATADDEIDDEK